MYTAEWPGRRLRDYTEASILKLEELDAVRVRRRFDGSIASARFLPTSPQRTIPSRANALSRCRHTRIELVGNTRIVQHKPLPYYAGNPDLSAAEREDILRASYSAAVVSALSV